MAERGAMDLTRVCSLFLSSRDSSFDSQPNTGMSLQAASSAMGIMATGENNQDIHVTENIKHFSTGMFELVKVDTLACLNL